MTSTTRPERSFGPAETLGYVGAALLFGGAVAAIWTGVTDPSEWAVRALLFGALAVVGLGIALTVGVAVARGGAARRRTIATALAAGFLALGLALNELMQGSGIWTVSAGGSVEPTGIFVAAAVTAVLALVALVALGSGVLLMEMVVAALFVGIAAPASLSDTSADAGIAIVVGIGLVLLAVSLAPRLAAGQREFLRLVGVVVVALALESSPDFQIALCLVAIGVGLLSLLIGFQPRPVRTGLAVGGAIAFGTGIVVAVMQTFSGEPLPALVIAGVGLVLLVLGGIAGVVWHRAPALASAPVPALEAPTEPAGALPAPGPDLPVPPGTEESPETAPGTVPFDPTGNDASASAAAAGSDVSGSGVNAANSVPAAVTADAAAPPASSRGRGRKAREAAETAPASGAEAPAEADTPVAEPAPVSTDAGASPATNDAGTEAPAAAASGDAVQAPPAGARISDDHYYWWDAATSAWRRTPISPDGFYYFDGSAWKPR